MAFPATVNSDIHHFIDKQATDRAARTELKQVFKSDPGFAELSISTRHVKVVNVFISGSLPSHIDLKRLRDRITEECQALRLCPLHWDLKLRDTNEQIRGLDRALFPSVEEAV